MPDILINWLERGDPFQNPGHHVFSLEEQICWTLGHSYDKYVLSSYNKPSTVLGAGGGGMVVNKIQFLLPGSFSLVIQTYQ